MRCNLIFLSLQATASRANTESIIFWGQKHGYNLNESDFPIVSPLDPYVGNMSTKVLADVSPNKKYFAYVSWPASQPADFEISWEAPYIFIGMSQEDVVFLGDPKAYTVNYELCISPFTYGLPRMFVPIVTSLIAVVIAVSVFAKHIL